MERIHSMTEHLKAHSREKPLPDPAEKALSETTATKTEIACIDDDAVMLQLMKYQLIMLGCTVTTFNGGEAFIDSAAGSKSWDIIVVDHLMPGMNGIQVLQAIVQNRQKSTLMCMACAEAFPAKEDQEAMDRMGCPVFLKGTRCCADIMRWYALSVETYVQSHLVANSLCAPSDQANTVIAALGPCSSNRF